MLETIDVRKQRFRDLYVEPPDTDSVGRAAEDEYNALVTVYDEPRRESSGELFDGATFAIRLRTPSKVGLASSSIIATRPAPATSSRLR